MSAREELYSALMRGGPHSPDRSEKASAFIDAYAHELAEKAAAEALRIVSDWRVEANEVGGVDAGDLSWRLEQAGYPLPDIEDGEASDGQS